MRFSWRCVLASCRSLLPARGVALHPLLLDITETIGIRWLWTGCVASANTLYATGLNTVPVGRDRRLPRTKPQANGLAPYRRFTAEMAVNR